MINFITRTISFDTWRLRVLPVISGILFLFALLSNSWAQGADVQAPPTSALKYGWYAVQLGLPHYDPDPQKTNLWSMYQFCFGNARKYHMDKFHVSLAHLSNDPTCVRVDGKTPQTIQRLPGCVSVQLTANCVAEPHGIIPEVDPQKLILAWRTAFANLGVQVPADFLAYQDAQPNGILKYQIRVSQDYRILPSAQWIGGEVHKGNMRPGTVEGAKFLLLGSVQVTPGTTPTDGAIRLDARLVTVESGEVEATGKGVSPGFSLYGLELDVSAALGGLKTTFRNEGLANPSGLR